MTSSLFIRVRGRVLGPFDHEKLRTLAARGQFGRMHEVSEDGASWVRASQFPDLFKVDERITTVLERPSPQPSAVPSAAPATPPQYSVTNGAASAPPTAQPVMSEAPAQIGWYYSRRGVQFGPIAFSQLKAMLADGQLSTDESVWTNGMAEWQAASEIEGLSAPAVRSGEGVGTLSDGVVRQLQDTRPWILLFAILGGLTTAASFIGAAFLLIMAAKTSKTIGPLLAGESVGGLVSAILMGIATAMLFSFANRCRDFTYHRTEHTLQAALASLKAIVVYWGVLTVINIVLGVILAVYLLVLL